MELDRDALVAQGLIDSFRARLRSDTYLVLLGNLTVLALVLFQIRGHERGMVIAWGTAVLVTSIWRAMWQHGATRVQVAPQVLLVGVRFTVALQALSWGIGAAILLQSAPVMEAAIILIALAGICASAQNTLAGDGPSLYLFLGCVLMPLPFGLLGGGDRGRVLMAALVVAFGLTMLYIRRTIRRALVEHLRTVASLTLSERSKTHLVAELREALANVKRLSGLLPICSSCKKVRDDMGYWSSVERYIAEHTDARFSHGVCPDCFPKMFPGIDLPEELAAKL